MKNSNVAILLATYNSERFIDIQIHSIIYQTYYDWILYIHDDGSTDHTVEIINEYAKKYRNIIVLHDFVQTHCAKDNFFHLLNEVNADYYMFCDHDDLWMPNKVEVTLSKMYGLEQQKRGPICVYTNAYVVDKNYSILSSSLWRMSKVNPRISEKIPFVLMFNSVTGCTMMINEEAKECILPTTPDVPMHDQWIAYSVLKANGRLVHLNMSTLFYCQHGDNVVGANKVSLGYVWDRIKDIRNVIISNIDQYNFVHKNIGITKYRFIMYKVFYSIIRFI